MFDILLYALEGSPKTLECYTSAMQKRCNLQKTQGTGVGPTTSGSQSGPRVLLDSCVWIYLLEGKLSPDFLNLLKQHNAEVVVEENVVREVAQVTKQSERDVFKLMCNSGLKVRANVADHHDRKESWNLVKSYDMCHYPDSLYLAVCKNNNWTLATCDLDLLSCARLETVNHCNPAIDTLGAVLH